jgi:hypothetical protein
VAGRREGALVLVAHRQPEVAVVARVDLRQRPSELLVQGGAVGGAAGPHDVADDDDSRELHFSHMKSIPSF